jgi:hypothetical protein
MGFAAHAWVGDEPIKNKSASFQNPLTLSYLDVEIIVFQSRLLYLKLFLRSYEVKLAASVESKQQALKAIQRY